MGMFDFVKEAGEKFFSDEEEKDLSAPISQAEVDAARADAIVNRINRNSLAVQNLNVTVVAAKLEGTVDDQECCEKVVLAAGNQPGIATVDCCLEVLNPEPEKPEATIYTVQSGDTLGGIAKAHYGDASKYTVIFEANQPLLSDPNKIYAGQALRIPAL